MPAVMAEVPLGKDELGECPGRRGAGARERRGRGVPGSRRAARPRPVPRCRAHHQQPVRSLRHQQVHQRRPLGPDERAVALLVRPPDGGSGQRGLLLELHRDGLCRALVSQRAGPGARVAALWEDTAEGKYLPKNVGNGTALVLSSPSSRSVTDVAGIVAPNSEEFTPVPASFKPRRSKPLAVIFFFFPPLKMREFVSPIL